MAKHIHKGTELNNVKETWEQNEKLPAGGSTPSGTPDDLERRIHREADEYEKANKEERLLGGERASEKDAGDSSGT